MTCAAALISAVRIVGASRDTFLSTLERKMAEREGLAACRQVQSTRAPRAPYPPSAAARARPCAPFKYRCRSAWRTARFVPPLGHELRHGQTAKYSPPSRLDIAGNADMMSDMKTFTVRDLDRSPSMVLDASMVDGRARIRARGGQTYIITPEAAPQKRISAVPGFSARRSKLFKGVLSASSVRELDKAIAGE